jgi:hypothetical protein
MSRHHNSGPIGPNISRDVFLEDKWLLRERLLLPSQRLFNEFFHQPAARFAPIQTNTGGGQRRILGYDDYVVSGLLNLGTVSRWEPWSDGPPPEVPEKNLVGRKQHPWDIVKEYKHNEEFNHEYMTKPVASAFEQAHIPLIVMLDSIGCRQGIYLTEAMGEERVIIIPKWKGVYIPGVSEGDIVFPKGYAFPKIWYREERFENIVVAHDFGRFHKGAAMQEELMMQSALRIRNRLGKPLEKMAERILKVNDHFLLWDDSFNFGFSFLVVLKVLESFGVRKEFMHLFTPIFERQRHRPRA